MTTPGGPLERSPAAGPASTAAAPASPAAGPASPAALAEAFHAPEHRRGGRSQSQRAVTSDLSIDETLLLHSIGWEPVELVCGASVVAIPQGAFSLGWNQIDLASSSYARATGAAVNRLESECRGVGGHGVIGVKVDIAVERHHVTAILVGTAVRPVAGKGPGRAFASDLSTRDFCLLHGAGWEPLGLAFGASFVQVPRRSASTALKQAAANVELTNLTAAMYQAREQGMERMQASALALGGTGMVDVRVEEGPLHFASHAIGFQAWGTAIRLAGDAHRYLQPRVVVPLDDQASLFQVEALGGHR